MNDLEAVGNAEPLSERSPNELELFRAALASANSLAHALADSLPGIVYLFDNEARLLWWNKALERITDYDLNELASAPISKFVPVRDVEMVRQRFQLVMESGTGSVQTSLVLKNGEEIPHLFTGHRMDFAGSPCVIGTGTDISEQLRSERRRAVRLAVPQLLAGADDLAGIATPVLQMIGECLGWEAGALWLVDPRTRKLCCLQTWQSAAIADRAFAELTQMSTFDHGIGLPGRVWQSRQPAWIADIAADENFPRASLSVQSGLHSAFACPLRAGEEVIGVFEFFSPNIRAPDAELLEMMDTLGGQIGQFVQQHSARSKLRRTQARTRAILDVALDCIIAIDHEERILEFNPAAEKTFGRRRSDVIGKKLSHLIIPERFRTSHALGMRRFLETGVGPVLNRRVELEALRADGAEFPVEIAIVATVLDGKPIFTAYLRDITDRKRVEAEIRALNRDLEQRVESRTQELQAANSALERAMQMKDEFLATVSHELRTPLSGVIGMVELLAESPLTTEQMRFARVARTSADLLLNVINDILDFSRLEAGQFELSPSDFVPADVVQDIAAVFDVRAKEKGLTLVCQIDATVQRTFHGDQTRLRQILMNLLANALKFTERGQITVAAMVEEVQDRTARVRFSITDTGVGISADQFDRLFQPFSQVDASLTRRFGGSGLGLAICRKLIERMGGQIGLTSELGSGSTFWFTLPLGCVTVHDALTETRCDNADVAVAQMQVLVAEDNPANQMVLAALLEKLGHRPVVVDNGQMALAACAKDKFDLILLDVQMPELDGLETARRLRQETCLNQYTPIVAVTAHVAATDRESFLASGMNEVLIKPIQRAELSRVLAKASRRVGSVQLSKPPVENDGVDLDLDSILARLEGDHELLADLLAVYRRDWPVWSAELSSALEKADWGQIAFKSHRLRGLVRTFSAGEADQKIAALEEAARRHQAREAAAIWMTAAPLLKALDDDIQFVLRRLRDPRAVDPTG